MLKKAALAVFGLVFALALSAPKAQAEVQVGVAIGTPSFYGSVAVLPASHNSYYGSYGYYDNSYGYYNSYPYTYSYYDSGRSHYYDRDYRKHWRDRDYRRHRHHDRKHYGWDRKHDRRHHKLYRDRW